MSSLTPEIVTAIISDNGIVGSVFRVGESDVIENVQLIINHQGRPIKNHLNQFVKTHVKPKAIVTRRGRPIKNGDGNLILAH